MQEMTTTANLVEYGTLGSGGSIAAVLSRSELEAARRSNESAGIWFELGRGENEEMTRLTLELTIADLEEMLRVSSGDEVIVALDADAVEGLFDPPDVEAHGMRGALAIAVATAAFAAPAGLAATPQAVGTASAPPGLVSGDACGGVSGFLAGDARGNHAGFARDCEGPGQRPGEDPDQQGPGRQGGGYHDSQKRARQVSATH